MRLNSAQFYKLQSTNYVKFTSACLTARFTWLANKLCHVDRENVLIGHYHVKLIFAHLWIEFNFIQMSYNVDTLFLTNM